MSSLKFCRSDQYNYVLLLLWYGVDGQVHHTILHAWYARTEGWPKLTQYCKRLAIASTSIQGRRQLYSSSTVLQKRVPLVHTVLIA